MTEYATDPDAIQEFLNSRDRCANWVNVHGQGIPFLSPSSPPSVLSDEDALGCGPSDFDDASSSHSLPPRMLLRYEDGRPDVPISHDHSPAHTRSGPPHSSSHRTHSRSASLAPDIPHLPSHHSQTISYASGLRYAPDGQRSAPLSPENIRILPSRQAEESQRPPGASTSSRRSRLPPAQAIFSPPQSSSHDRVPLLADPLHTSNRSVYAPTPRHAASPTRPIPVIASPPNPTHAQSQPGPGSQNSGSRFYEQPGMAPSALQPTLAYHYSPPAIVYAPSSKHGRSHYQPPQIVYSPPSHGHRRTQAPAPGITYSRSDPLPHPTQYSPQSSAGGTPFPSVHGSVSHRSRQRSHSATEREPRRSRASSSARRHTRTRSPTPPLSESDTSSDTSGSTYYVLPSPGQKVQIVVPNSASVYTTTPKTPRSPSSSAGSPKKPFFQRFFSRGSGSVDSRGSSGQGKRLLRRHTVGGTHMPSQSAR